MENALLMTIIGMFAVYVFLFLLMYAVRVMSLCVHKADNDRDQMEKITAVIGIALQGEKNNGCS